MPVNKQKLLNGAPKRPRADGAPGMMHQTIVGGEKVTVRGATPTQVAHMLAAMKFINRRGARYSRRSRSTRAAARVATILRPAPSPRHPLSIAPRRAL